MKRDPLPQERLTYTMAEACSVLGISEDLGYQLASQGDLPILQLGRRKLIPRAALERMVAQATRSWEDRHDDRTASNEIRAEMDRAGGPGARPPHR